MQEKKVPCQSMDIEAAELEKLKSVFPQCFAEGKLNTEKLLSLVGKYAEKEHERYSFEWNGKTDAYRLAAKRSMGTLRPCPAESVNFDTTRNLYIEGDNLEVLKQLQKSYFNQVKMIYIDPPYNTGNDFVYTDDFAAPLNKYKEVTQQTTKSNPETMGRFHTNWLNMMLPRLRLAYNLLRDDGVIFISIDDNEVTNLRKLCDEVFGEENFVGQIVWERAFAPVNLMKHFSVAHDYIVCYAKNLAITACHGIMRTKEANDRYANPDNDPRGVWSSSDISVGPAVAERVYPITTPSGRVVLPPTGRCWALSKENFEEKRQDNRIWFGPDGNGVPRIKRFLSDLRKEGITPITIWKHAEVGHSQDATKKLKELFDGKALFSYPKPVDLIKRCITLYSDKDSIILDFFSGSATTAHAVMQLNAEDGGNRRFICVQLPELCDEKTEAFKAGYKNICEIGKERIRRAGKKILDQYKDKLPLDRTQPLDTGFKVFKLDSSNLVTWDASPIKDNDVAQLYGRMDALASTIKKDRTDLDLVYEVMLKLGIPLDQPVHKLTVNGKEIWSVGKDHTILVCLNFDNKSITQQDIETLCEKYAPAQIVAAEGAFKDDSALSNAYYTLNNRQVFIKLL